MTSRLVLEYVEHTGGRAAVDEVLARCGVAEREAWLRDESSWLPYSLKIDLFRAAADVLGDAEVTRHMGERALDFNVGRGLTLALRALGSPRVVYQNVVRANARFSHSHSMELLELHSDSARVRFVDLIGVDFEPLDCQYNQGLLSCVPGVFGLPPARVSHPECAGDGAPACVYEVSWSAEGDWVRFAGASLGASAAALAAAALLAPAALPLAAAAALSAAALSARRIHRSRRARWRALEREVRSQAEVTDRLLASMQDLVSELRIDEVPAKITQNAEAVMAGKQFVLLVEEDGALRATEHPGLAEGATTAIERWAGGAGRLGETAVLIDDCASIDGLRSEACRDFRSVCAAPLLYRGGRLGVLVALASHPHAFLPRDMDLVQWYASQAAIALANARFYAMQEALASRDPLTGLLNHREFHQALERELERARRSDRPVSVTLLDLDGFKEINDLQGHARGDVVLTAVAQAIDGASRAGDLAFRVGGDEFAVLLPETQTRDAAGAARRTCEAIAAATDGVTASFGTATWPGDGGSKEVLLAEADHRLYAMKAERDGVPPPQAVDPGPSIVVDPLAGGEEAAATAKLSELLTTLAPETHEHSMRVAALAESVGRRLRMDRAELRRLRDGAMLHDLGKLGIAPRILGKRTPLSGDERRAVEHHSEIGARVLAAVPDLAALEPIVRAAHERWDGSGYPDGLSGERIPRAARVIAVCDAFDTMTSEHAYRPAMSLPEALAELRRHAGTQFDPAVVDALLADPVCHTPGPPPGKESDDTTGPSRSAVRGFTRPDGRAGDGGEEASQGPVG